MPEYSQTGLNPLALAFAVCLGLLLLLLPRRYALLPLFAGACYMTMGQSVNVAGLNFDILRILVLIGWLRVIVRGEFKAIRIGSIDKAMLWWTLSSITIYTILWGTSDAFINQCGRAYDAIGLYLLFRALVRDVAEIIKIFKSLVFLIVPLAAFMLLEKVTGRNAFGVFGGVPTITYVRDGVLRCQGPFPHSILAGTFGAALLPFFVALWWQKKGQILAVTGVVSSTVITLTAGSSGPVMTCACAILALCLWRWRFQMQLVRRGIVFGLLGLQLAMKEPFWFVIAHMGVFSGSTAYYRAFLIDQTIRHFSEWWLIGTRYEQPWAPLLTDITDWYVRVALDGGLLTLILLFVILKRSYASVGRALRLRVHRSLPTQRCIWVLGAALFAHTMTFLGVWYWDQNIVNWYLLLAMIATVATPIYGVRKQPQVVPGTSDAVSAQEPEREPEPAPAPAWPLGRFSNLRYQNACYR
jgi:hypothetical protein